MISNGTSRTAQRQELENICLGLYSETYGCSLATKIQLNTESTERDVTQICRRQHGNSGDRVSLLVHPYAGTVSQRPQPMALPQLTVSEGAVVELFGNERNHCRRSKTGDTTWASALGSKINTNLENRTAHTWSIFLFCFASLSRRKSFSGYGAVNHKRVRGSARGRPISGAPIAWSSR